MIIFRRFWVKGLRNAGFYSYEDEVPLSYEGSTWGSSEEKCVCPSLPYGTSRMSTQAGLRRPAVGRKEKWSVSEEDEKPLAKRPRRP